MLFDGGMGFGQRVGAEMMERLVGRARELGAVVASLRNVHHLGRIGAYAEMAVAAGLVSVHFVNVTGHPPLVAPFRGSQARFGTNPICIGVPGTSKHEPFLLDMATSHIALGKVRVALNKGERIAPGTLVDARGRPTTDPKAMFPDEEALRGALLPLGLHKGYGLLFAAELLAGVVGGGETSNPATAQLDTIRNNMLSVVIDPASLVERDWMERELDTIVDYVTSSPPADPDAPVLVAGDPERATMKQRMAEGIPVDRSPGTASSKPASSSACRAARRRPSFPTPEPPRGAGVAHPGRPCPIASTETIGPGANGSRAETRAWSTGCRMSDDAFGQSDLRSCQVRQNNGFPPSRE